MRKQKPVSMAFRRVLTVVLAIAMCLGTIVSPQPAAAAGAYTPGMLAMSGASLKVADIYVKPTRPPGALDNTYVASNAQIPLTLTWNVKSTTDPSYSADSVWFGIRVLVPDNEGLSFVVPSWLKSLSDNTQPAPAPVSDGMGHLVLEGQYNYANTALPAGPGSTFSTDIAVKTASGTPDNTTFTPDAQVWLVADSPNGATGSVKASVNNGAAPLPPKITIISSPDYNSNVSPPVNLVTGYYSPSAGKMFTSAAAAQAAGYNDAVYGRVYGASMDVSNAYNTGTEMLDKNVPLTWNSSISVISGWNTASQATITDPAYTPVVIGARLNTYVAGVPTTSIIPGQPTDMTLGGAVPHPNNNGANPAVATPSVTLGPAVGGVVPMQVTMTLNDPTLNNDSFYTSVYVMIFVPLDPTYTDADYNDATTQQRLVIQDTQTTGQSVTGAPINNPNGTTYLSGAQTILPGLPPDPQAGDYSRHVQFDGLPQPVTAYLGEGVSAKAALTTTTNDLAHVYNAANVFMKIDDEAYTPTAVYLDGPYSGSKTILYAAKADGSGWTSLDEMNTTHDNDPKLVYYDSLAALQAAGKTCVGILGELRGGISSPGTVNLSATLSVNKDVNLVSKQYSILEDVRAWAGNALASTTDSYKGTNGGALPALPANNVFMYSDGSESGTSTTYKQPLWNNGARVTQYTSRQEENTYGDTLLIVGYYLNNFRTGNLNGVGAPVDCYLTPANNTTSFNLSRDERIADRYLTFDLVWSGPAGTEPVGGPAMLFGLPVQMSSPYITIIPGTAVLYRNDIGSTLDYSNFIPAYYTPGAAVVDPGTFNGGNTTAAYAQSDPLPGYAGGTMNGFRVNLSGSGTKSGSYTIGYSAYLGDAFNPAKDLPTGTYAQQFEIGGVGATRGLVAFPDASWAGYDPEGMKVGQSGGAIIQVDRDSSSNFRKTAAAAVIDPNGQIDYRTISAASGVALNGYYALDVLPYNGDGRGTSFNGTYIASKATVAVSANTNPSTSLDVYYTTDAAIRTKGASGARPTALDIKNAGPLTDGGTALGVVWHLAVKTVSNGVATYDFGGANPTALVYTGTIAANETPLMDVFLNTSGNKANNVYANDASSYAQDYIDAIPSQIMPVTVVSRSISGTAWIDYVAGNMSGTNENGARDPLEPVLAGLKVRLWQGATEVTADVNGNPYNVTTDATGHYVFNDVPDSATPYRVTFESGTTDISKYLCTWKNKTGADPTLDSDVARVYQADGKTLKEADSDPFTLPALAANANINQQIDAGFLPIPPLTMQNITVMVGKTANGTATTTYLLPDGSTPTFSFTQPVDTNKATLTSAANVATATGVTQGVTPATVSFANSLGDVFTTNYTITVVGALKLMYDGNGNTGGTAPTDPADYASGDGATVQPFGTLARTGYTLKPNWNTAPDGSGTNYAPNAILTMTNNTTLYAQWTPNQYTVHYAPNTLDMDLNLLVGTVSGTTADSTHLYDVAKNLTANGFSIPGYTFIGWNTAANGSGTFYSDTQSVTNLLATNGGEITLYAQWKMAAAYKITYVLNGGSVAGTNPTQYTPADLVANVLPNGHHGYSLINPTKPGYLFDGWTPDAATMASLPQLSLDHNMYVEIPAGTTGDLNFTAAWQPIMYSVRYNPNTVDKSNTPLVGTVSGTMANSQHLFDVAKNLTANAFSIPGYTFVGWNSQPDGSGTSFANLQSVINLKDTDNAVYDVYAQWQISSNLVIYYYDGFVPDGADPLPAYSMQNYGTQVTVAPQPASVPGYTFAGWTTSSPGVTVASGKFAMPANDVVFHGVWTATPYTVNYDTDGGTPATILPMTGVNWAQAGLLPDSNPTKTGYTFTGWNVVDPVGGKAGVTADDPYSLLAGNVDTVRAITLKAQWTPNSYPVTYAYTGMVPAGAPGLPASSMNEFNTQVTVATAPTLPGYTFSGWSTASPGATISAGKFTMPANAVLLTGSWTATRYTVTYNTDGGTPSYPADTSVFWPDTGLTPATPPTKAGYQFVGWDVNTTGGMTGVQSSTPYSQLAGGNDTVMSVELIARWAPASATLYKVQHYKVNSAGVAVLADTETFTGTTDQPTAAVTPKTYVGYTYAPGYNLNGNTEVLSDPTINADGSTLLKLYYTANKVTLNFDKNTTDTGSTDAVPATEQVTYGEAVGTLPATNPTRPGYVFKGWTTVSTSTTPDFTAAYMVNWTDTKTVYAVWQANNYTVNYDTNGGMPATILPMTTVTWGQDGLLPAQPTKTGYTFGGWNVTVGGTKVGVGATDKYSDLASNDTVAAITLQAQWTINNYPVTYSYTGAVPAGAPALPATANWNYNASVPISSPAPTLAGYTFSGWTINTPGVAAAGGNFTMPAGAVALSGSWTAKNYTVTYDTDGGTPATIMPLTGVNWNDSGLLPAQPTKTGYQFIGWNVTNVTGGKSGVQPTDKYSGLAGGDDTIMTINLQAQWAPANATLYKVQHYKVNSAGVAVLADTETFTGTTDQPTAAVTPKTYVGYTYAPGYNLNGNTEVLSDPTINADGSTLLKLYYTANKVTLNFDKNTTDTGSTDAVPATEQVTYGEAVGTLPATNPTRPGYTFMGWATVSSATTPDFTAAYMVNWTDTKTVYAVWQAKPYTVTYNMNGGTPAASPLNVGFNDNNLLPTQPTKTGYTFTGWNMTGGKVGVQPGDKYSGLVGGNDTVTTIELAAQWTVNNYPVSYDYTGMVPVGAPALPATVNHDYNTAVTVSTPAPTLTGYTFSGWSTSDATVSGGGFTMPAKAVLLTGSWTAKTYTVNYDTDGGTPATILPMTGVLWGDAGLTPPAPTKEGYTFAGWNVTVGGSKVNVAATDKYSDLATADTVPSITLKAQWTKNNYPVSYSYTGMVPLGAPALPVTTLNAFGDPVMVSAPAPTLAGYTFSGWSTSDATVSGGSFTMPAKAVLLSGSWTANTYTVQYDTNGGTPATITDKTSVLWGDAGLLPPQPTKTGYQFIGWNVVMGGTKTGVQAGDKYSDLATNDTVMVIKLQAQWAPAGATLYKVQHYKVDSTGAVTLADTETFTGTTDQPTAAVTPKTYVGYTYAPGYNLNGNTEVLSDPMINADGSTTLKLYYTADKETLNFDKNTTDMGSTDAAPSTKQVVYNEKVGALPATDPTRPGYTFKGWTTTATSLSPDFTSNALVDWTGAKTVYAVWQANAYMVNYDTNGGTPLTISPLTPVTWGQDGLLPAEPSRTGYTFDGWNVTVGGSKVGVAATDAYSDLASSDTVAAITLQAQWKINNYPVVYSYTGTVPAGAPALPATANYNYNATVPISTPAPTLAGYTFSGWSIDTAGVTASGGSFTMPANAVALSGSWTAKQYTVTYDTAGGSPVTIPSMTGVNWNDAGLLPAQPTKTGYQFAGWNVTNVVGGMTGVQSSAKYSQLANGTDTVMTVNLQAQWLPADGTLYKVQHYKVDSLGNAVLADTETFAGKTGDPTAAVTPKAYAGYTYAAAYSANGNTELASATIAPDGSTTLRLYYTANKVTLNFDKNTTDAGSTDAAPATEQVVYNEAVTTLPTTNPTRPGYSFLGWATVASATTPNFTAASMVDWTDSKTVYAVWQAKPYVVTYDTAGGTPATITPLTVGFNDDGLLPAPPTKEGYTFAGWDVTSGGTGTDVQPTDKYSDLATSDSVNTIVLTAQWDVVSYPVAYSYTGFVPQGAPALPASTNEAYGSTVMVSTPDPTRAGYTFSGWTTANPAATVTGGSFTMPASAVLFTGYWTPITYTVNYDTNGGTPATINPMTGVNWNDAGLTPAAPTKTGYTFAGWNVVGGKTGVLASDSYADLAAGDDQMTAVTLQAQWLPASGTLYKAQHYKVDSTGAATLVDTDTFSGTTGQQTAAVTPKSYVGYTYVAAYNMNGNTELASDTIAPDGSTTLRFYYTADTVTLNFDKNTTDAGSADAVPNTKQVVYNEAIGALPATDPVRPGYAFMGWASVASALTPDITAATLVNWPDTKTVYAVWQAKTYTVSYDSNGGTPATINDKTGVLWNDDNLLPSSPTRPGYDFNGWDVVSGGSGTDVKPTDKYSALATDDNSATLGLQAQWTARTDTPYKVEHYTVNFAGVATLVDTQALTGTTDTMATATPETLTGYSYAAGYSNGADIEVASGNIAGDGSLVLKLYYTADTEKLVYDKNTTDAGSTDADPNTADVIYNEKVGTLPTTDPTRPGYTFEGWSTSDSATTPDFTEDTVVDWTEPKTVYAVWQANTYTVHYDTNGGSPATINDKTNVHWADGSLLPTPPTRTGYTFTGWQVTAGGKSAAMPATASSLYSDLANSDADGSSITLTAQWSINSYPVTINWFIGDSNTPTSSETTEAVFNTTFGVTAEMLDKYRPANGYGAGEADKYEIVVSPDGNTINIRYKQLDHAVQVRYHTFTADGDVIDTVTVPGTYHYGDVVDPASLLNNKKPKGFADGVAVGTSWTVTDEDSANVFDVYYPDTAPVINVERRVINVRQPVSLSIEDILRIAGVSVTDPEENIPNSAIDVTGYDNIKWSIVNYPSGDGYVIKLQVTDSAGLTSEYQEIAIFVEPKSTVVKPNTDPSLPKPPNGTQWGTDEDGNPILYIPVPAARGGIPKTSDSAVVIAPAVMTVMLALALMALRRRKEQEV